MAKCGEVLPIIDRLIRISSSPKELRKIAHFIRPLKEKSGELLSDEVKRRKRNSIKSCFTKVKRVGQFDRCFPYMPKVSERWVKASVTLT